MKDYTAAGVHGALDAVTEKHITRRVRLAEMSEQAHNERQAELAKQQTGNGPGAGSDA